MPLNLERCRRGMTQLDMQGCPRNGLIEEAIAAIQRDPVGALRKEYFGIKNYAGFGDQREDHPYGYGPKHGSIVFRIGRENPGDGKALDNDAIYYLEAYRDFGTMGWVEDHRDGRRDVRLDLGRVIRKHDQFAKQLSEFARALDAVAILEHAVIG
jgi:hypothetical protein